MAARLRSPVSVQGVPEGTVLYDGVCVLCSAWFGFVAARDEQAYFRFAAIQGAPGRRLALRIGIDPDDPETNVVFVGGRAYLKSDAALQVLRRLPRWGWAAVLLQVPRPVRDWLYDRVARNRYRLFGRTETCMVPDARLRRHLLPDGEPLA